MDSILTSVKQLLGLSEAYTDYDNDIVLIINATFMTLTQLGVGPEVGFSITDKTALWTDFLNTSLKLEGVKLYVSLKTRLSFDPPSSSFVLAALENQVKELEFRINIIVDNDEYVSEEELTTLDLEAEDVISDGSTIYEVI